MPCVIALPRNGHAVKHAPQTPVPLMDTQSRSSTTAVPISTSAIELSGRNASVGHAGPQARHIVHAVAIGSRYGVPCMAPASAPNNLIAPTPHASAHRVHRIHGARNSDSSNAPGGRTMPSALRIPAGESRGSRKRSNPMRTAHTAATCNPIPASLPMNWRRPCRWEFGACALSAVITTTPEVRRGWPADSARRRVRTARNQCTRRDR